MGTGNGQDDGSEAGMVPWVDIIAGMVSGGVLLSGAGGTREGGLAAGGGSGWPPATGMLLADVVLVSAIYTWNR